MGLSSKKYTSFVYLPYCWFGALFLWRCNPRWLEKDVLYVGVSPFDQTSGVLTVQERSNGYVDN